MDSVTIALSTVSCTVTILSFPKAKNDAGCQNSHFSSSPATYMKNTIHFTPLNTLSFVEVFPVLIQLCKFYKFL